MQQLRKIVELANSAEFYVTHHHKIDHFGLISATLFFVDLVQLNQEHVKVYDIIYELDKMGGDELHELIDEESFFSFIDQYN